MAPLKKSSSLCAFSESDEGRSSCAWSDYQAPAAPLAPPSRTPTVPDGLLAAEEAQPKAKPTRPKKTRPQMKIVWTEITPNEEVVIVPYLNDQKATLEDRVDRLGDRAQLVLRTNVDLEAKIAEKDRNIADLKVELDCRQDEWSNLQGLMQEHKDDYEEAQGRLATLREQRLTEEKRLRERHLAVSERLAQLTGDWHRLVRNQAEEERTVQQNKFAFEDLRAQVRILEQRKADLEFGDGAIVPEADISSARRLFEHVVSGPQPGEMPQRARKDASLFGSRRSSSKISDDGSCTYSTSNLGDVHEMDRAHSTFGGIGDRQTFGEGDTIHDIDEGEAERPGSTSPSPSRVLRSASQSPKPSGGESRSPKPSSSSQGGGPQQPQQPQRRSASQSPKPGGLRSASDSPKPPPEPRVGAARPPVHRSASKGLQ